MTKPSIVFFGSGPVAAESLRQIMGSFKVEAIITKPATATEMQQIIPDVTVHTVSNKHELDTLIENTSFQSQLAILIDFGIIVSKTVIESFPFGIINSHFSLLPEWRGADPISFAILSGQASTGVSLMMLDEGMDTGKLITTKKLPIEPTETTPNLTNRLITLSSELLTSYVPRYLSGDIKPRQQPHQDRATYSRKLTKDDGIIDWTKPAVSIEREIRAFYDWPKSRTTLAGKDIIVTQAHVLPNNNSAMEPGQLYLNETTKELGVATSDGILIIDELKPAGKQKMPARAFLAGYRHLLS